MTAPDTTRCWAGKQERALAPGKPSSQERDKDQTGRWHCQDTQSQDKEEEKESITGGSEVRNVPAGMTREPVLVDPTLPDLLTRSLRLKQPTSAGPERPLTTNGMIRKVYFKNGKGRLFSCKGKKKKRKCKGKLSLLCTITGFHVFFQRTITPSHVQHQHGGCNSVHTDVIFLAAFCKHTITFCLCSPGPRLLPVSANTVYCPAREQAASSKWRGGR